MAGQLIQPRRNRKSLEYWRKREELQRSRNITDEKRYAGEIRRIYQRVMDRANVEIEVFYARYAKKEQISMAEARKRVSRMDIEEYARKAEKYVREKDFSKQANDEMRLYNAAMRINRLEMLKANIGLEMVDGFDELEKYFGQKLTDRTLAEFERQAGILGSTIQDNQQLAHSIVNASFHNATFSDRIWCQQAILKNELGRLLTTGLIQGRHPRVLAEDLQKRFDVSRTAAERLMITELTRVQIDAQKKSYERNGYDSYTFIAEHDARTCRACAALDGKVFKVKDMEVGDNAPPIHPLCRCSTAAAFSEEDERRYEEWLDSGAAAAGVSFEQYTNNYSVFEGIPRSWNRIKEGEDAGLQVINPNYNPHLGLDASKEEAAYNRNCVNAVVAYDLREKGWDVEARSYLECDLRRKAEKAWEGVIPKKILADAVEELEHIITMWGENGRAFIGIHGDRENGHAVVAKLVDEHLALIDPQRNLMYNNIEDIEQLLSDGCVYWRIDNVEVSQTGINACKGR